VCSSAVLYGDVLSGLVWQCSVKWGVMMWSLVMYGEDSGLVRSGLVMQGQVEFGTVLFGMARQCEVWYGTS